MGSLDRPKLRPLHATRHDRDGQSFAMLSDSLGVVANPVFVPLEGYNRVVRRFDGATTLDQIRQAVQGETGQVLDSEDLGALVRRLDQAMVLDGPTFASFRDRYARQDVRPAACAGRSYPSNESALRNQIDTYFAASEREGMGRARGDGAALRAVISPHIDFHRGQSVYPWAYHELARDGAEAEIYVILGVAHQFCGRRFALTRKHFETPLGVARTDRAYVDRLAELAGAHLFDDELAHRTEHSIEFQAVLLNYLFAGRREVTIVPILVGSFHDLMLGGVEPVASEEVRRFIEALRTVERESGKRVAYIGGIDLCHVGPEFGDPNPVDEPWLERVAGFDRAMLGRAAGNDPEGWFRTAAEIRNKWRVCGLAATYTMLHAIGPARGRLLKYGQAVDDRRTCCVTFASLAFEGENRVPA